MRWDGSLVAVPEPDPDPDVVAARPELMLAAAAVYEREAHRLNSISEANCRSANQLLATWEGRGAFGFQRRVDKLSASTSAGADAYLATATALRKLAAQISEAQTLLQRGSALAEQVSDAARSPAFEVAAWEADAASSARMIDRGNAIGRQAWLTATAAFDAITATAPSVKNRAVLTSEVTRRHAKQRGLDSQVKIVTEPDGKRVYSLDGGLAIPVSMHGARRLIAGVEAYMPKFEHSYQAAGLSGSARWFAATEGYCASVVGAAPRKLRNLFFTDRFSSITMRQVAGASMLTPGGDIAPTPDSVKPADLVDNGDGPVGPAALANAAAKEQIDEADKALGTQEDGQNLFSRTGPRTNVDVLQNGGGLPRTQETVQEYARLSGIDLADVDVHIVDTIDEARYLDYWSASAQTPQELAGRQFNLGPASFSDEETLVRNISHEYTHILQLRAGGEVDSASLDRLENEAYAGEEPALRVFYGSQP